MKLEQVTEFLSTIPDEQLISLLQQVFERRQPNPEERDYNRNCFFLGTASKYLESKRDEPEKWGDWEIKVVGYPDREVYPSGLGPDYGLCQSGTCPTCGVNVRSNVKNGICPICASKVYMT